MSNIEMASKAPYAEPKLVIYGGFSQLTAGGSGVDIEGPNMGSRMRRP